MALSFARERFAMRVALVLCAAGCSAGGPVPQPPATGSSGGSASGGGVSSDSGGTPSPPDDAGNVVAPPEASTSSGGDDAGNESAAPEADSGDDAAPEDGGGGPTGPVDFGAVGQEPLVPVVHTPQPVPPIVTMDCPTDPTQGYTEYDDSFVVQRPYDLPAAARFSLDGGIYTEWIFPNDKPHATWSGTHPRTETRYSDMKTGEHFWSGDVLIDSPSDGTCMFQVKGALGPIGVYLTLNGDTLSQGGTVLAGARDKWFNLKVAWDSPTGTGRIFVNNCLKQTIHGAGNTIFYFKHGTYHCDNANVCRDHFKNIHLYQKGSMDVYNVKSPIR
jgi:hypothetical protein